MRGSDGLWVGLLVAVGVGLRVVHFLRNPSVWHDEAAVVLNVLWQDYPGMFGRLAFFEAAPPLFLCAEKAVVRLFGSSTEVLRLLPLLAGCWTVALVAGVGRRLLPLFGAAVAVLLVGCSETLVRHSFEAKPYAVDACLAAVLLWQLGAGRLGPSVRVSLWLTLATPVLVFLSFPACFLLGSVAVCRLSAVWRERCWRVRSAYLLTGVVLVGAFLLLLFGPVRAQRATVLVDCWGDTFPDWRQPWSVPGWLVVHTLGVARYAYEPVGNLLAVLAVFGAIGLTRRGRGDVVLFTLLPPALAGIASLGGHYPFGAFRVLSYAAPGLLLLMAAGFVPVVTFLRQYGVAGPVFVAALVLFPVGQAGYRLAVPWSREDAASAAAFVRRHWQPGDRATATAWQYDYHLRDLGAAYQPIYFLDRDAGRRLWFVAAGMTAAEREREVTAFLADGGWREVQRQEFVGAVVLGLARVSLPDGPRGGP